MIAHIKRLTKEVSFFLSFFSLFHSFIHYFSFFFLSLLFLSFFLSGLIGVVSLPESNVFASNIIDAKLGNGSFFFSDF